ncbi:MAG: UDP-glucose/GDP-mannose dehydrogenase family protein [Burkholderiaceae bacterium]|nr:UDP-glucose/GDP-mannose dehydrogenase family protein [Burkholderiaceae bacterium]
MKICVVGTGYVGLVSGTCLAEVGHEVACVDLDADKVARINRGEPPIHEEGLEALLRKNAGTRLTATTSLADAMQGAEVALICVGTPFDGKTIDLGYVSQVARDIGTVLKTQPGYCAVTVKSTVVPGTTDTVVREELENASGKQAGRDFGLGMNPEFLAEGVAVKDFMQPDRIVVGGIDDRSTEVLARMYAMFEGTPIVRTTPRTAEMIKYTSNAFMATMISFSNEIARICDGIGDLDAAEVFKGLHLMKHLTRREPDGQLKTASASAFLWAGCGFGGSCFPKDVKAIAAHADHRGVATPLLDAVLETNRTQPSRMMALLEAQVGDPRGRRVTVLGLAFKPGTDDVRESPALPIVADLVRAGAQVAVHDPIALDTGRKGLADHGVDVSGLRFEASLAAAIEGADAVMLVTSWPEYREVPALMTRLDSSAPLIDGRRLIERAAVPRYSGIGLSLSGAAASAQG